MYPGESEGDGASSATFYGPSLTFTLPTAGAFAVAVAAYARPELGSPLLLKAATPLVLVANFTFPLVAVAVRRELRALSDGDKARFLDAMATLWRVDTLEGRRRFGPSYTGIDRFLKAKINKMRAQAGALRRSISLQLFVLFCFDVSHLFPLTANASSRLFRPRPSTSSLPKPP